MIREESGNTVKGRGDKNKQTNKSTKHRDQPRGKEIEKTENTAKVRKKKKEDTHAGNKDNERENEGKFETEKK